MIPNGIIQVSRAKADESDDHESNGPPPREDEDSRFLYVVRDQYKDFEGLQLYVQEASSDTDKLNRNSPKSLNQCSDWVWVI
jgi:hypothetical protein